MPGADGERRAGRGAEQGPEIHLLTSHLFTAGGRVFPGVHSRASFRCEETDDVIAIRVRRQGREVVRLAGTVGGEPASAVFADHAAASAYFREDRIGYSPGTASESIEGLELDCATRATEPMRIRQTRVDLFDRRFASYRFDHALIMRANTAGTKCRGSAAREGSGDRTLAERGGMRRDRWSVVNGYAPPAAQSVCGAIATRCRCGRSIASRDPSQEDDDMDYEQALKNPTGVFAHPDEVCESDQLSDEQKIRILKRWEYDARELEVAADENMAGGPPGVLDKVLAALHRCGGGSDTEHSPPTKQGGE